MKTRELVGNAFLAAILVIVQVAFSFLPNIEFVSLLIILYTLVFEKRTVVIIYLFALLEGILYGFGVWWIMYLYVWTILYLLVRIFRKNNSLLLWAVLSGFFGLAFGMLCAVPYAVTELEPELHGGSAGFRLTFCMESAILSRFLFFLDHFSISCGKSSKKT